MIQRLIFCILFFAVAVAAEAKIWIPEILGDNMVLQQQAEVKLWGKAAPGCDVTVTSSWCKQKI
ncbi:MAG: sialate O-acetylesterase, partial [Bacteroidales bacterium]|nr:sialate O-acetylesterase [Bacteroidales bacterium]